MNKVFIVMPFSNPYEDIYSQIIEPTLVSLGFHPVRVDEILDSRVVYDKIINAIEESQLVIIEASENNKNVFFEFGVAKAKNKETIILSQENIKIPFDTSLFHHLLYNLSDLGELKQKFEKWVKETKAWKFRQSKIQNHRLERGDIFDEIVDATFHIQNKSQNEKKIIKGFIDSNSLIPCQYIYSSDFGSMRWLELCNDPLYDSFNSSVRFLNKYKSRIIENLGINFVKSSPDYVSLGPGNGIKDKILLGQLLTKMKSYNIDKPIYYYPYDINLYMLSRAVQTVASESNFKKRIKIKATCAEFKHLSSFKPVYNYRTEPNVFTCLGNTMGNFNNERVFLRQLKSAMFEEDILLLEVRKKHSDILKPGGSMELRKKFNFSPLEKLGVEFEEKKLVYEQQLNNSHIPDTVSIIGKYKNYQIGNKKVKETILTHINHYQVDKLKIVLSSQVKFEIIDIIESRKLALFMLKKPKEL